MSNRAPVFHAETLTKRFGTLRAVDDVTMAIDRGEIYGLVGPSGSGKTTLIRMLCGLAVPTVGAAELLGSSMPSERRVVEHRFGYMPQERAIYRDLSVAENLLFFGQIYGMLRSRIIERTRDLLDLMKLSDRAKQRTDKLSGGEKQRLSLACALLHEPEALLLDEPTIGLDPALRREFWDHFHELNDNGRTILLSTHYLNEAEWCDRVGLMQLGRLIAEGTPDALKAMASARSGQERPDMEEVFLILTREGVAGGVS
ncbi:ABC transporter ATP-binding protein [Candidatus Bipolaricaulota bacterium]|jgi:ABC-2 type transport system ATP-binding protein|nr:ABC transporter ATP-binding protein [Candidatus Bipolaricaulota bacterium]TFH07291.1 MAG: ABC transporter ATP-binding protein [Candidatus Atribacteria bacterium]